MRNLWALALSGLMVGFIAPTQAADDIPAGKTKATLCGGCHGPDGNSVMPLYPKLAGQIAEYLVKQLKDFKSRTRQDAIMSPLVSPLSDADMRNIAAYHAGQKPLPGVAVGGKDLIELGKKVYRGGNAKTGVSACMSCHGPSGHGIPPKWPRVSGQHAAYTQKQLMAFKNASRSNDDGVMTRIAFRMSETEIKAVSEYMAGLK